MSQAMQAVGGYVEARSMRATLLTLSFTGHWSRSYSSGRWASARDPQGQW